MPSVGMRRARPDVPLVLLVLLFVLLVQLSTGANGEAKGDADGSCQVAEQPGEEAVLLQGPKKPCKAKRPRTQLPEPIKRNESMEPEKLNWTMPLPLCHHSIVSRTCIKWNGGHRIEWVTAAQIASALSANESMVDDVWKALLLSPGEAVKCHRLCSAVVTYIKVHGGTLPPYSDRGCYTINNETSCDVDLNPAKLAEGMWMLGDMQPDDGVNWLNRTAGLLQQGIPASGGEAISGSGQALSLVARPLGFRQMSSSPRASARVLPFFCPYTLWETVAHLSACFRIFVASGTNVTMSAPSGLGLMQSRAGAAAQQKIATLNLRAKALVSTVVNELSDWQTARFRAKWFGGSGGLSESAVRQRIQLTMNFAERELGMVRYVYPADGAVGGVCQENFLGYVWKLITDEDGYSETEGPVCWAWEDPMTKKCGVDQDGNYIVYLCRWWGRSDESVQVATLVHEIAHHAGPGDIDYDKNKIQRISQAEQLDNAANYENFARDVALAAWGCPDSEEVTGLPFTCGSTRCSCQFVASFCDHPSYGEQLRAQCPATCGMCTEPVGSPTLAPPAGACEEDDGAKDLPLRGIMYRGTCYQFRNWCTEASVSEACPVTCGSCAGNPTPASTPLPTPAPTPPARACEEGSEAKEIPLRGTLYRGTCYQFRNWCTEASVSAECPVTCGQCTKDGCEDDPNFSVETSVGRLTCEDWQQYSCWPEVVDLCPSACRKPECTR